MNNTMMKSFRAAILLIALLIHDVTSFALMPSRSSKAQRTLNIMHEKKEGGVEMTRRRGFISQTLSLVTLSIIGDESTANAVERAVGGAEKSCREEGNCLEKFEIDGAVGWSWGGKDRCDA